MAQRRSYGSGSLYQQGDRWYGHWRVGNRQIKRALGPVRQPGAKLGLTKSMAEAELRKKMSEDIAPLAQRITVGEAGKRMIKHAEALGRKHSTTQSYESFLRVHLDPYFEDKPLAKISKQDVGGFIDACRNNGQSAKSIRNYLGLLHGIFDYAIREQWITANPVKLIDKPRAPRSTEIRFLDQTELDMLLAAVPDDDLGHVEHPMYLTAAMTGLRQGELLGLRWMDIDWTVSKIRVRQTFVRGEFNTPKSERSRRSVPLPDAVGGALERLYQASPFQATRDLVFAHPHTGKPIDRSRLLKRYKAALKRAGVRPLRFHDLRHTFGTRVAAAGIPMRTIQEWMGHKDFATTLIYADYAPAPNEIDLVNEAFGSNLGSILSETQTNSDQEIPGNPGFADS